MNAYDLANNNAVYLRDVYPTATGNDTGAAATGRAPSPGGSVQPITNDPLAAVSGQGVIIGGLVFLALVVGLMFAAKYAGNNEDFKALKPSAYNVVIVALAAAAGLPVIKLGALKLASVFPAAQPVAVWINAA
jgi:hypothetical protein